MHGHTENVSLDVACVNRCGQLVMRRNMNNHVAYRCSQRLISCVHCNFNMKQVELKDHYIKKLWKVSTRLYIQV